MTRLAHPPTDEIDLSDVLRALSYPVRRAILCQLLDGPKYCQDVEVAVANSTRSQHFKALREAGLTYTDVEGRSRLITIREADIESRFPGLLQAVGISRAATGRK